MGFGIALGIHEESKERTEGSEPAACTTVGNVTPAEARPEAHFC